MIFGKVQKHMDSELVALCGLLGGRRALHRTVITGYPIDLPHVDDVQDK